ncbi:MAG TPA: LytR C-terminal domain-containing protein [Acidimicrobiales bacterium]|nr:LytR C-terminal domain-containing protein [Acidimicrobiales bacterium]
MSPSARGVFLVAAAVALGVGILSSIGKSSAAPGSGSTPAAVSSTTTTTAPAGSTTTTTQALATHSPSSVKVLVVNGTSVAGVAGKLKTKLAAGGYDLLAPTNTTSPARASAVYYQTGYQGDAQAVASAAGLGASTLQAMPSQLPVASTSGAQVIVVIGPDLAGSLQ